MKSTSGAATSSATPAPARRRPIRASTPRPAITPSDQPDEHRTPRVSVIVPTYNEADNIVILLERLTGVLADMDFEIVVVDDDSADGTWKIAQQTAAVDRRVKVVHRVDQRGLSSAVLAGMAAANGQSMVVMDADLQHDEQKIPELVSRIVEDGFDVCLGSREAEGGSYGDFRRGRLLVSWTGAAMARVLLGVPVTDPMSGFFAVSRDRYEAIGDQVNPRGFKILLEFLARGPKPTVCEVGYRFGQRLHGTTKLDGSVAADYLVALTGLTAHRLGRRLRRFGSKSEAVSESGSDDLSESAADGVTAVDR